MAFSKLNFITPINAGDKVIRVKNINGLMVHIIKESTATTYTKGSYLYLKQSAESNVITLDFSSEQEAKECLILLRTALATISNNTGINVYGNSGSGQGPSTPIIPTSSFCDCLECDRHVVLLTDIWTQSNQIPYNAPILTSGVVQILNDIQLNYISDNKFSIVSFIDIIPPYFGDGISYNIIVKTFNDIIIPSTFYKINLECGYICFPEFINNGSVIVDPTHLPKVSFFKYTGNKGVFNSSANTLEIGFHPNNSLPLIDLSINIPVPITNVISLYVNGVLIDNNIIVNYTYTPSITAPTILVWKDTAEYVLNNTDIITIQYI